MPMPMSTLVERPLSIHGPPLQPPPPQLQETTSTTSTTTPLIPQRRRREPSPPRNVEIIDVDELDDDEIILVRTTTRDDRPTQRRRISEPIETIILDSDDEDYQPLPVASASGSGSGSGSSSNGARSRLISPPLRPRGLSPLPPMPPIPPHLASQTSLPMRRHPPNFPSSTEPRQSQVQVVPPPLRPLDREFDFESFLSGPAPRSPRGLTATEMRRRASSSSSPRQAGPSGASGTGSNRPQRTTVFDGIYPPPSSSSSNPSASGSGSGSASGGPVHRPAPPLGLGGGLISTNNLRLAQERAERGRRAEARAAGGRHYPTARRLAIPRGDRNGNRDANPNANARFRYVGPRHPLEALFGGDDQDNGDDDMYPGAGRLLEWMFNEADRGLVGLPGPFRVNYNDGWDASWKIRRGIKTEPDYRMRYTHPNKPEPGFTFDFVFGEGEGSGIGNDGNGNREGGDGVFPVTSVDNPIILDEEEGEGEGEKSFMNIDGDVDEKGVTIASTSALGSASTSTSPSKPFKFKSTLVCSHCRDPLILGEGTIGLTESEARKKKIWSLRCGHLIDGKCFEMLGVPEEEWEVKQEKQEEEETKGIGKGTEKANGKGKGKGKGKEKAVDPVEDANTNTNSTMNDHSNSIRSRLRPRPGATNTNANTNTSASTGSGWLGSLVTGASNYFGGGGGRGGTSSNSGRTTTNRKSRDKGKEKQTPSVPRIERVYEWKCPVPGCGRVHESVKMVEGNESRWGVDKESGKGVIQVFV